MERSRMARSLTSTAVACVLAVGVSGGASIFVVSSAQASIAPRPQVISQGLSEEDYPENDAGESYGSAADAATPYDEPDLIKAVATNGVIGYVRNEDLGVIPESLDSLADNKEYGDSSAGQARDISVFAEDGETIVGVFHIEAGDTSRH